MQLDNILEERNHYSSKNISGRSRSLERERDRLLESVNVNDLSAGSINSAESIGDDIDDNRGRHLRSSPMNAQR